MFAMFSCVNNRNAFGRRIAGRTINFCFCIRVYGNSDKHWTIKRSQISFTASFVVCIISDQLLHSNSKVITMQPPRSIIHPSANVRHDEIRTIKNNFNSIRNHLASPPPRTIRSEQCESVRCYQSLRTIERSLCNRIDTLKCIFPHQFGHKTERARAQMQQTFYAHSATIHREFDELHRTELSANALISMFISALRISIPVSL